MAEYWCRENPGLDLVTKTLAIRLRRAAHHLETELRRELAPHDMDLQEFEVLLSLRRGAGHSKSAGELMKESQVTSGSITNRVARLEQRGWVRRDVDPSDRRQVLVTLTEEGLRRSDRLVATKTETEQRLFAGVERETLARMSADLRTLLLSLEGPATSPAAPEARPPARPRSKSAPHSKPKVSRP
jgi:DNA-binding MarR family transcriptional regulator